MCVHVRIFLCVGELGVGKRADKLTPLHKTTPSFLHFSYSDYLTFESYFRQVVRASCGYGSVLSWMYGHTRTHTRTLIHTHIHTHNLIHTRRLNACRQTHAQRHAHTATLTCTHTRTRTRTHTTLTHIHTHKGVGRSNCVSCVCVCTYV